MKARLLKKLLNDTDYYISNHKEYIAIGSSLCHDLISIDKDTLKVKYALDTFRKGRESLSSDKLTFTWDKLHELIESGEIQDIINGKDEIENPLPVFSVEDGQLIESVTEEYGWPNIDENGNFLFSNSHFPTKEEAIEHGIKVAIACQHNYNRRIKDLEEDLIKAKLELEKFKGYVLHLQSL